MSGPYVYVPQHNAYTHSDYAPAAYTPASPFIPSASLYHSPYTDANIPLPDSPNMNSAPLFPSSLNVPNTSVFRPRRLSWHGDRVFPSYYSPTPAYPNIPLPDTSDPYDLPHRRRHSFSYPSFPYSPALSTWDPYAPSIEPLYPSQLHIHPWLNAQTWTGEFLLNLADAQFNPMQLIGPGMPQSARLDILSQPATYPPLNRLRIVCSLIPDWPIDLRHHLDLRPIADGPASGMISFDTSGTGLQPPILLRDVLIQIHRTLHTRITHGDWAKLSSSEETAVSKAYRRRCKALGSVEAMQAELAQGVKRVDYLLHKVWFRGCVVDLQKGVMRLIVG
ncbi:hypothetical protein D9758_005783 [Tetrapyrgos nigripes]|uniref:DUF6699 domain-containing protein n=1 Tax=Tetrapyrgos nigripes TaxID=182062 RepID=A0A8H5GJN2_9AGAR|nr:hypothetical protein D9758_005783 [Tetrapyrgos nigripes]